MIVLVLVITTVLRALSVGTAETLPAYAPLELAGEAIDVRYALQAHVHGLSSWHWYPLAQGQEADVPVQAKTGADVVYCVGIPCTVTVAVPEALG